MGEQGGGRREFWMGAREILPIAFGVAVYGAAFGILAAQASMSGLEVGVMGAVVFAGASQIVAVERIAAGAGAFAAVVAGLAINLRMLLVTASIREIYAGRPWWQVALGAHFTTDENWALTLAERAKGRKVGYWHLVGGGACLMAVWLVSTIAGAVFASAIPEPRALGMDFAFTAAFIALSRALWRGRRDLAPWVAAALVVIAAIGSGLVAPSWAILLGGLAGAGVAATRSDG